MVGVFLTVVKSVTNGSVPVVFSGKTLTNLPSGMTLDANRTNNNVGLVRYDGAYGTAFMGYNDSLVFQSLIVTNNKYQTLSVNISTTTQTLYQWKRTA